MEVATKPKVIDLVKRTPVEVDSIRWVRNDTTKAGQLRMNPGDNVLCVPPRTTGDWRVWMSYPQRLLKGHLASPGNGAPTGAIEGQPADILAYISMVLHVFESVETDPIVARTMRAVSDDLLALIVAVPYWRKSFKRHALVGFPGAVNMQDLKRGELSDMDGNRDMVLFRAFALFRMVWSRHAYNLTVRGWPESWDPTRDRFAKLVAAYPRGMDRSHLSE